MPKTTIEQWRMFSAVAEFGGFNQAAANIHKSQSSIHHAVKKLEESLGTKLFETEGRRAVLTESGSILLRRGEGIIKELRRVESVAQVLSSGTETSLNLAIDEAFPQEILYKVLEQVSSVFPLLKIELLETVLAGNNELLIDGKACIGLSPIPIENGLNEEICQIEFVAVAAQDHPLHALDKELDFEDLRAYRHIVVRDSSLSRTSEAGWLDSKQRWTVSHLSTSIDLVTKGLGYAWLPIPSIEYSLKDGLLRRLKLAQGATRKVTFCLNYHDADGLGPAAKEFMGQLRVQTL